MNRFFALVGATSVGPTAPAPSREQTLGEALSALRAAEQAGDQEAVRRHCDALVAASPDTGQAHVQLCEAGESAAGHECWEAAERLAVRSLVAFPKYGAAFRLLSIALAGQGRRAEALMCARFQLPDAIEEEYFGDLDCRLVQAEEAMDAGVERVEVFPAESRDAAPPRQLDACRVSVPELEHRCLNSDAGYLVRVPEGRLWFDGSNLVVWDRAGRIVSDASRGLARVVHAGVCDRTSHHIPGRVCAIGNRSAHNYYHWMCDVLPALQVVVSAGVALDTIDRAVVAPLRLPFQQETLEHYGLGTERLYTLDRGYCITADEILLPRYGSNSLGLRQGEWMIEAHRQRLLSTASVPRRRLYVSRGTAGKRGVVNDDEVLSVLEDFGFELMRCEEHSVTEQARRFAEAEAVVGPHGAGLTNILFCEAGTKVLELFNAHIAPCFWVISQQRRFDHALHYCGSVDIANLELSSKRSDDKRVKALRAGPFEVDPERLVEAVRAMGLARA